MTRVPSRRLFLIASTGLLLASVSVLAQGTPRPPASGRQDEVLREVDGDAIRRLAMQLKGMGGGKTDADLLKQMIEFAKTNPNATPQQKQEFAKKLKESGFGNDKQQLEQMMKQLGFDPKNPPKGFDWGQGDPKGPDFKGFDPKGFDPKGSGNPPQPPPLPPPPASTPFPKQPTTPPNEPGGGSGTSPEQKGGFDGTIPGAQPPKPGQTWNPDTLAEQQKNFQQVAGWWEQNIGPLNETPAVRELIKELFTNSAGGGAGSFGELFNGADPNDVPDLGLGGSGWKLPDMGFGSGASSTGTGFTPPSAPDATSFGGFGSVGGVGGDSWLPVIVLAVVMAVALVLWWLWPRIVGLRDEPRPLPGLGPWPIDPRSIADREGLVKAFEYLSVLVCGAGAKVWNHVTIATALERAVPQADALADPLARLYAVARYTPANEDLPPGAIAEARQYLCELAGVRAA